MNRRASPFYFLLFQEFFSKLTSQLSLFKSLPLKFGQVVVPSGQEPAIPDFGLTKVQAQTEILNHYLKRTIQDHS